MRREAAQVAVGIAEVQDRRLGVLLGDEGGAVAAAFAGGNSAPLDDLGIDSNHRADVAVGLDARDSAVKREAWSDEVEAVVATEANAGAVGEAVAAGGHRRGHSAKPLQLHLVERVVFVGAGEMAVERVDRQPVEAGDVGGTQAEAVHAGVDHHVARPVRRDRLPPRDLFERVEHRTGSRGRGSLAVLGPDSVKDDHAGAERQRPQGLRLCPGRNEEVAAACVVERAHGLAGAEAVAVGFDRGPCGNAGAILEPAPVFLDRSRVDRQPQRMVHRRRPNRADSARRDRPWRLPNCVRRTVRWRARLTRRGNGH